MLSSNVEVSTNVGLDVLHKLFGPKEAQRSFDIMQRREKGELLEEPEMTWREMLASRSVRGLLVLGGGVAFFSQAQGIESIMYYSSIILDEGGLSRDGMLTATMVMGFFKLAAIIVQSFAVDDVGRRPLLLLSSVGMSLSMLVLSFS